jgi:transposase-like protein
MVGRVPRRQHAAQRALREHVQGARADAPAVLRDKGGWLQAARRRLDPAYDRACVAHAEGRYTGVPLEELAYQYRVGKL